MAKHKEKAVAAKTTKTDGVLGEVLAELCQKFGEGVIMRLDERKHIQVDTISTGALSLDLALGVGGVPRGRVVEIFGPESSGKTTLALHIIAEAQRKEQTAAFIDAEHALDPDYAQKIGVRIKDLLISQPDSGEQGLQVLEALVRSGEVGVVVIDSVAALVPRAEVAGEMGEFQIGLQARLMSQALRKVTAIISKTGTVVIFLNQIRMKIGVLFGNPETTPGGMALKFYSSVRIDLRRRAQLKHGEEIVGSRIKAKIVKNKVAAPFKIAEFDIYYNQGISYLADLLNLGLKEELIKRSGSWLQFGSQKLGQGIDNSIKLLQDSPALAKELRKQLVDKAKKSGS